MYVFEVLPAITAVGWVSIGRLRLVPCSGVTLSRKNRSGQVRVADAHDPEVADCSDDFYLMASEEAPEVGDVDGPYLFVTSPKAGDSADAGGVYTVEVSDLLEMCDCTGLVFHSFALENNSVFFSHI